MFAKIVFLAYLVIATKQQPQVIAGLPYVANYASSYNAHTINHDIRIPVAPVVNAAVPARVVQPVAAYAPAAPLVRAAPITSAVSQVISAYSPVVASYSLPSVPFANPVTVPLTATPVNPQNSPVIPATSRVNPGIPSQDDSKPTRSTQLPETQQFDAVPSAVLLASQFLVRNPQQSRAAPLNPKEDEQNQQPSLRLAQNQPLREQANSRDLPVLGATPTGFGFIQRQNTRFAQIPQDNQPNANLGARQIASDQNNRNGKLIRENEDSESVQVNNPSLQNYEPGKVAVPASVVPARLAVAPRLNLLPNVYSSFYAF